VQGAVLTDDQLTLTVDLTPARVGVNQLHMYATTPDGRPLPVVEWTARASNASGIEGLEATIVPITDDHAIGQVGLPTPGAWTLTFTLRLDEITNAIVSTTFTVSS
jgi:copper transport protein